MWLTVLVHITHGNEGRRRIFTNITLFVVFPAIYLTMYSSNINQLHELWEMKRFLPDENQEDNDDNILLVGVFFFFVAIVIINFTILTTVAIYVCLGLCRLLVALCRDWRETS